MSSSEAPAASADEQPKRTIAKKVVSRNKRYFVPKHGKSVKAASPADAAARLDKAKKSKSQESSNG